jgi:hypothetical protein
MIYNSPDSSVCDWWDVLCKNGDVIRIRFMPKWKHDYPWHSIEFAYTQDRIDFIGHKFMPVALTNKEEF